MISILFPGLFKHKQVYTIYIGTCLAIVFLSGLFSGCSENSGNRDTGNRDTALENSPDSSVRATEIKYTYVGKETCSNCHKKETELYTGSDHELAMQYANKDTILGDFNDIQFTYNNITSRFFKRGGKFFVTTDGPDGKLKNFEIKYTFGVTPLQQYLIELPGGRLQALSIAWDSRSKKEGGQRWFHLYPDEKIDYRDSLHWSGKNQNWNYMCAECHSTGFKKNYDPDSNDYHSSWADIDVSCEACHGPGSRHVELAARLSQEDLKKIPGQGLQVNFYAALKGKWLFSEKASIASLDAPRDNNKLIENCARCHSRRTSIDSGDSINKSMYDTHTISLLEPELYFPDGQIKGEVYVYGSFLQSKMYAAGVSCNDCHDPHSTRLRFKGNSLCLQCHKADVYDTAKHHFHTPGTNAADCTACHMPAKNFMQVDTRYDHSFRIPRPDLSISIGVPNTCNQCHADRSPRWAADTVMAWYGKDTLKFHYGEALDAARQNNADAVVLLERVLKDNNFPVMARATAMEKLGAYLNPGNIQIAIDGLASENAMLRSASMDALSGVGVNDRFRYMHELLDDPAKSVRINAARLLAPLQGQNLPQQLTMQLENAIQEYVAVQKENSDRAYANVNLGNLYADTHDYDKAVSYYKKSMALETDFIPAYVNMADLYRLQNLDQESEAILRQGLKLNPRAPVLHHALGLALVREKKYNEALTYLGNAERFEPDNARYAVVYAVALNSMGEPAKAIEVLTAAYNRHPKNRDLLVYLATLHRDNGEPDKALGYAEQLVKLSSRADYQAVQLLESVKRSLD